MLAFGRTRFLYEDPVATKCAVPDAKTGLEGFIACVAKQIKYKFFYINELLGYNIPKEKKFF